MSRLKPLQLAFAALPFACGGTYTSESEALPQGIAGVVTKSIGGPISGQIFPISVPVHVVRGRVPYPDYTSPANSASLDLVVTVHSGDAGKFGVGLPPGTYTVFAEIEGEWYRNCFTDTDDGEVFCWEAVEPGTFVEIEIDDTSDSTF